jgi:hypothetical protein
MQSAKRDAPQYEYCKRRVTKECARIGPVPSGCREEARLPRCDTWHEMALAFVPRLASIAFSQQRSREISVNTP